MDIPATTREPSVFRAAELAPMTPGGRGPSTSPAFPPKAKFRGNSNSAAKNHQASGIEIAGNAHAVFAQSPAIQPRCFPPTLSIPPPPQLFPPGSPSAAGGAPHLQAPGTPSAGMIRAPSHRFPASSTVNTAGTYGSGGSGWSGGGGGAQPAESMKRKRPRFAEEQLAHLEAHFAVEQELTPASKKQLAARLGVKPRQVCVWFQNRKVRQRTRERETELEGMQAAYTKLQATCRELQDDYELLKSDYQELLLQNTQLFDMMQEIEQQLGNPQLPPADRPVTSRFNDTTGGGSAPDNQPAGSAQSDRAGQSNQSEEEVEIPSARLQPLHQQQQQRGQERQHLAAAAAAPAGEAEEEEEDEEDEEEEEENVEEFAPCASNLGNKETCFPTQEFYPTAAGEVSGFTPSSPSGNPFHIHTKNQVNLVKPPSYQSNSPDSSLDEIGGAPFALPPPAFPIGVASSSPAVPQPAPPPLFEPLGAFASAGNRVANMNEFAIAEGESERFVASANQQEGPDLYDLYSHTPANGGGGAGFLDGWMDGDAPAMQQSAGLPFGLTAKAPADAEAEDGESDSEAARRTAVHGGKNAAFAPPTGELVENGVYVGAALDGFSSWNDGLPQPCMEGAGEAERRCSGGEFVGSRENMSGSMRGNQEPFDLLGSMEGAMGGMGCAEDGGAGAGVAAADDMASMCGFDMHAYAAF
ncbi:unnamed protein product [Closterium sp. Naga37s-1]|nr:unnamed protein product [Closterium sp. Naga37s-1]